MKDYKEIYGAFSETDSSFFEKISKKITDGGIYKNKVDTFIFK